MITRPCLRPDQGRELEKVDPPLAPPSRLKDRRQEGELRGGNDAWIIAALFSGSTPCCRFGQFYREWFHKGYEKKLSW